MRHSGAGYWMLIVSPQYPADEITGLSSDVLARLVSGLYQAADVSKDSSMKVFFGHRKGEYEDI